MALRLVLFSVILALASNVGAQADHNSFPLMAEALEWPKTTSLSVPDSIDGQEDVDLNGGDVGVERRSLYWQHAEHYGHYYISYGALSANRIPCPPGSGRSYENF
ncbi:PREDICTED: protein RALF-like 34 [Ipomoea nil]|uniref:protein RALF-like 34 n=1 Tax=Ipomoea nil TaxID=35883 RepID=UPI00090201C5|nr:PREDICTED: protein RALF-like 34 [Ipomoea nil]